MKNSEQSAFPLPQDRDVENLNKNGLTKREYFAAMAMQGILANPHIFSNLEKLGLTDLDKEIAIAAVEHADALLKQLENEN